jgi:hypothetical protein
MADIPTNEHLWAMVVTQARLKYHPYPSPGASAWVHRRYIELGGKFESHDEKTKRQAMLQAKAERNRKEKAAHGSRDPRASKDIKKKVKK